MKTLQLFIAGFTAFATASAQKLPEVQQTSLRAPENIKIDGKAAEWGDKFEAYNTASRVFYTISNDKDNLYMILRMDGVFANDKAIGAGITLTLDKKKEGSAVKNKNNTIKITFPGDEKNIEILKERGRTRDLLWSAKEIKVRDGRRDSLQLVVNKLIGTIYKQIETSGLEGIADSAIPIYNSQNIQVASRIDDNINYTYELALPLKYISSTIDSSGKIKYNIKINGTAKNLVIINTAKLYEMLPAKSVDESLYGAYATDFSGEYTLAK